MNGPKASAPRTIILAVLRVRIAGIHVAEMDLAFVGNRGAAEQDGIAVDQDDVRASRSQGQGDAAALQTSTQHCNPHSAFVPRMKELRRLHSIGMQANKGDACSAVRPIQQLRVRQR